MRPESYNKATMVALAVLGQLTRPVQHAPWWQPGIRARLFLLALVTLSPLVGVVVFQDYYHLVSARQRADADAARLSIIKAGDVDQLLQATEMQLTALRPLVSADPTQVSANEAILATAAQDMPAYIDGIAAYSTGGEYLGAGWRDAGRQVPNPALHDQVADTEAGRRLVVGQPLASPDGRSIIVLVSRALTDRTRIPLVLILSLRPDRMPALIDSQGLPPGSTVSVVDVRGPLLARSATDPSVGVSGSGSGSGSGTLLGAATV